MQDFIHFAQAHWELCLAFVLVLMYWLISEFLAHRGGVGITPVELVHLMNRERAAVVDLRDARAFEQSHILGALSFPEKSVLSQLNKLKKYQSKPIILVDSSGATALRLVNQLIAKGFPRVRYLKDGMKAWHHAGLPLEKDKKSHAKN